MPDLFEEDEGNLFNGIQSPDKFNPGRIRMADINTDGFPDIIVTGNFIADPDFELTASTQSFSNSLKQSTNSS